MKIEDKFSQMAVIPYDSVRVFFGDGKVTIEFLNREERVATEEQPMAELGGFVLTDLGVIHNEVG